jgi:hypothetical protein
LFNEIVGAYKSKKPFFDSFIGLVNLNIVGRVCYTRPFKGDVLL